VAAIIRSGCPFIFEHFIFLLPPRWPEEAWPVRTIPSTLFAMLYMVEWTIPARAVGDAGSRLDILDGGPAASAMGCRIPIRA
jgi:hypothetical protein